MSARDIFGVDDAFTTYEAQIQVRDILVGGVPSGPSTIRSWLRARLDAGDAELEEELRLVIAERDEPVSVSEQLDLLMKSDAAPSINGFKHLPSGELAYEGRCLKGALKEWANSAYPGTGWDGKTDPVKKEHLAPRKGLLSTLAERVFINPPLIGLGVSEPTRREERIKRVRLPDNRPASAISRVEVVERPLLTFEVKVRDDFLTDQAWGRIWQAGEEIGIGADRARSDGRFDLVSWKRT